MAASGGRQQRVDHLTEELARRQQSNDALVQETRVLSRDAQDTVKELQAKVGALDGQVGETRDKQVALEQVYQDLMRNRDDWEIAEIQQLLTNAGQQLQLTGNVQVALAALQSADARLARTEQAAVQPAAPGARARYRAHEGRARHRPDRRRHQARRSNQPDRRAAAAVERTHARAHRGGRPQGRKPWRRKEGHAMCPRPQPVASAPGLAACGTSCARNWRRSSASARLTTPSPCCCRATRAGSCARTSSCACSMRGWRCCRATSRSSATTWPRHGHDRQADTRSRRVQTVLTLLKQAQAGAVTVQLPTMAESLGALHALKKE
ncbi:uroporphyrinogen-III C-methyltransferase [Cupriavidus basilensis]